MDAGADADWIREVEAKITSAFGGSIREQNLRYSFAKDGKEAKIRKLSLPKLETEEDGFSQPSVVAVGPFHRGARDEVSISDNEKRVIVALMNLLYGLDLASCLVKMKKNQVANARRCYYNSDIPQSSGFEDDKSLAEMLLLDSYFILFMLTVRTRNELTHYTLIPLAPNELPKGQLKLSQDDPSQRLNIIFNKDEIAPDLLIFDNQIPFFVIEELFKELKSKKPLHEYALNFFETIHPRSVRHCKDKNISPPPEFLHLLHLFHWSRVPQNKYDEFRWWDPEDDSCFWVPYTPNAMELNRKSAAVFEKKASGSSLDITFQKRGVLDIPELHIRKYSSLIFYNLIAFEMQPSSRGRCTMAFSVLMRNLLQSEEDVQLLRRRGILVSSSITDRQLIDLFQGLSRLTENHKIPCDLSDICEQVLSTTRT